MIRHVYSILCGKTLADPTSQISIIDVIEEIRVSPIQQPPGVGQQAIMNFECTLVTYWVRTPENNKNRGRFRLVLESPSGKCFSNEAGNYEIDLAQGDRMRATGKITALPVGEWGMHQFLVQLQIDGENSWEDVGFFPLFFTQQSV